MLRLRVANLDALFVTSLNAHHVTNVVKFSHATSTANRKGWKAGQKDINVLVVAIKPECHVQLREEVPVVRGVHLLMRSPRVYFQLP